MTGVLIWFLSLGFDLVFVAGVLILFLSLGFVVESLMLVLHVVT